MNKNVVIVGTGKSGLAAGELLLKENENIVYYNSNKDAKVEHIDQEVILGEFDSERLAKTDLFVFSPGVSLNIEVGKMAKEAGIPIWGEVELAYSYEKGSVVAITGTNGKTTTTSLVGKMMQKYYKDVFVVGNIGVPYTQMVEQTSKDSVTVAEISSFQLETTHEFRPHISAILNITPDHLDRHGSMEEYARVKCDITKNQTKDDYCVLNYEDALLREKASEFPCQVVYFSSLHKLDEGCYLEGEDIVLSLNGTKTVVAKTSELNILGKHNHENAMAAILMAFLMNVPVEKIHEELTEFVAEEHRFEFVCEKNGVVYYNDSKGTNPDASIQAIRAMTKPTYLIGGGYDKGASFDEWVSNFSEHIKELVILGKTAPLIEKTAIKHGFTHIVKVDSLKEAVDYCKREASAGEAVLLSPACASWDMFKSYEERGWLFKEYVRE